MLHRIIAIINAIITIFFTCSWSNVFSFFMLSSASPMRHISVSFPIEITFPTHCHCTNKVPEKRNGWSSPQGLIFSRSIFSDADFLTGLDSPVRSDSSTLQFLLRNTTQSAGILSHSFIMTMSSITTSLPAILTCSPFLITNALGLERSFNACSAFSVLFS